MSNIVVIGAGIAGISSALAIQKKYPHAKITIIADSFSPHLTSDIAAGFWWPYLVNFPNPDLLKRICRDTFEYIASLVEKEDGGAMWQSGYEVSKEETEIPHWASLVRGFRRLSQQELNRFGEGYKSGQFFTTLALEPTVYIAYATKEFVSKGGIIRQGKVKNLQDLAVDFDTVINCSGLGARDLVGDKEMSPIRGQVIRVRAPRVKHFFCDGDYYCLLKSDSVQGFSWDLASTQTPCPGLSSEKDPLLFYSPDYEQYLLDEYLPNSQSRSEFMASPDYSESIAPPSESYSSHRTRTDSFDADFFHYSFKEYLYLAKKSTQRIFFRKLRLPNNVNTKYV